MNRHIQREKAMICIYQNLLINKDVNESVEDTFKKTIDQLDEFENILILHSIENKERFITYINEELTGWTFDRLGYLEQAILLIACSEFDCKTATANIIIDEAINLAKAYCDDDAYKLINSVLDRL